MQDLLGKDVWHITTILACLSYFNHWKVNRVWLSLSMVLSELEIILEGIFYFSHWLFVIGDGLSGDQLCGRYKNYSQCVARLSCACMYHWIIQMIPSGNANFWKRMTCKKMLYVAWNWMVYSKWQCWKDENTCEASK